MAIFLTDAEKGVILANILRGSNPSEKGSNPPSLIPRFFDALQKRVYERVESGKFLGNQATTIWWHSAAEFLSDAAMSFAVQPTPELRHWLNVFTLEIVRKPAYEWVGPAFRDHSEPFTGHLETAHVCWGISAVYDLAKAAFSAAELVEIKAALEEKGITLCRRWIDKNQHLANWRSILVSGAIVSAVVLEDEKTVLELIPELELCQNALQNDGSYGESLQYGNYLALAMTFAYEAVSRKYPSRLHRDKSVSLPKSKFMQSVKWFATSQFYAKRLHGWGDEPRARAANFNDSAAIFRPSGDVLLHIAARSNERIEKGLAIWLFEKYYAHVPTQMPNDLATLGMRNDWGFLTLPLLTIDNQSITPEEANLPLTAAFSNGNAFIRDDWQGKTIVAINGGSEPLSSLGHLHGDLNSFILVHNQERLLADPGHSCYRNLIHGLESSSQTHNTCTFLIEKEALGLQEDLAKAALLEQKSVFPRRIIKNGQAGDKILRGDKRLICEKNGTFSIYGAEAAKAYGQPIETFSRFWILGGSHVLFIIDRIIATQPVTTLWNWVVNNQDRQTKWAKNGTNLTVKRQNSGMKLFHGGDGTWSFPVHGFLHDAYHPEPNQLGEGSSGGSLLFRFTEKNSKAVRTVVHAIALDEPNKLIDWSLDINENNHILKNDAEKWTLTLDEGKAYAFSITKNDGEKWDIQKMGDVYKLIQ